MGKDKWSCLAHLDEISVVDSNLPLYYFIDEGMQLAEELRGNYIVGRVLGSGATAEVKEAFTRNMHERRAIKIMQVVGCDTADLMQEAKVLKGIKHPCIAEILEVHEAEENVSMVMEFAAGGDLFDQVEKDFCAGTLEEGRVKIAFYQIAHAIAFLHSKKICHRDLKLENILLVKSGPTSRIKVADFGLSKKWSTTSVLKTYVGTPVYMAPEVISGAGNTSRDVHPYSCKSDCWSLGVILYTQLVGRLPFDAYDPMKLKNRVSQNGLECCKPFILLTRHVFWYKKPMIFEFIVVLRHNIQNLIISPLKSIEIAIANKTCLHNLGSGSINSKIILCASYTKRHAVFKGQGSRVCSTLTHSGTPYRGTWC